MTRQPVASSSSKKLESKDEFIGEALPTSLVTTIHGGLSGIQKLIYDYFFDIRDRCPDGSLVWLQNPCTFFGAPSSREKILACARYAGPLEQLETDIRKAHARGETHLQNTLEQAIPIAVICLDQTIRTENGTEIDRGAAETLLDLYAELYPREAYLRVLDKAKLAAPLETPEDNARESLNLAALDTVFTAFIQNDEAKTTAAIKTFKEFVRNTKPEVMINNRYHLNLIHLIYGAFNVLANRGGALPRVGTEEYGQRYGKLANQFCFEIIGAAIEKELPSRARQLVRVGLYYLFTGTQRAARVLDVDGLAFLGVPGSGASVLGVDSYYDRYGVHGRVRQVFPTFAVDADDFQNLLRAITSASKIYYTAGTHSLIAPVCDNGEVRRSPAATAAAR